MQRQRLEAVLADLDHLSATAYGEIADQTRAAVRELAISEAQFSADLYNKASRSSVSFSLPAEAALINAVDLAPMRTATKGVNIEEALLDFGTKKSAQIRQIVADGVVLGDTTAVIAGQVNEVVGQLQTRQAMSLVKTITNHTSAVARESVYTENSELLDGYKFVATLDSKTTLICASNDNKVFQPGAGPRPPLHWGCRSTTVPVVKPAFSLGSEVTGARPSIGSDGAEVVSANTSYGGWLKKQPVEFVDEALGVERSRLFRSGKMQIKDFVDPTGRVYTLKNLREQNVFVFLEE